jgi:hypothetical protein
MHFEITGLGQGQAGGMRFESERGIRLGDMLLGPLRESGAGGQGRRLLCVGGESESEAPKPKHQAPKKSQARQMNARLCRDKSIFADFCFGGRHIYWSDLRNTCIGANSSFCTRSGGVVEEASGLKVGLSKLDTGNSEVFVYEKRTF